MFTASVQRPRCDCTYSSGCNCCTGPDASHKGLGGSHFCSRGRAPADLDGMFCGAKTGGDGRPFSNSEMRPCGPAHIPGKTTAAPGRGLLAQRPTATAAVANLLGLAGSYRG